MLLGVLAISLLVVVKRNSKRHQVENNLKKEENIDKCFTYLESIETKLDDLKKYKKLYQIKIKRMQNILNQIRSYNIIRKELEKKKISDSEIIDKKIEIINDQIEKINIFLEILREDIHRVKTLY